VGDQEAGGSIESSPKYMQRLAIAGRQKSDGDFKIATKNATAIVGSAKAHKMKT